MRQTIVVGITGGIAAYKTIDLVKRLKSQGCRVVVVETPSAMKIVPPKDFEKVSGEKVISELFQKNFDYTKILKSRKVEHIDLAQSANLIVIAPATANVIAKLAGGITDDYLTTSILAATCPILVCPSMNVYMWHHPATQKNIATLKSLGYHVIDPDSGMLACGYEGQGRLAAIDTIEKEIEIYLKRNTSFQGKRVIVTAGGTKEPIDDIRFITNRSSGKMGVALAEECWLRGADVLLIRSKNSVRPRYNITEKLFETADDLEKIVLNDVRHVDICIHAAAVSDFSVGKIKGKLSSNKSHSVVLQPRQKILDRIKRANPNIFLVAFKAEAELSDKKLIEKAKKRMAESHADMIIANRTTAFDSDKNEVFMIGHDSVRHLGLDNKKHIAGKIIDEIGIRTS